MNKNRDIFLATLLLLVLLNIGVWLLQDFPNEGKADSLQIPYRLGSWQGEDVELSHNEEAILAPARIVSRAYRQTPVATTPVPVSTSAHQQAAPVIWLNVIQTNTIGHLHNFFDSLEASGTRPAILGTRTLQTAKGPLHVSLIRYFNAKNQPYNLLLWYQWQGGNAANRWSWYGEVLKVRLRRQATPWQLVEVATPIRQPGRIPSPEVAQLEDFARRFYEASFFQTLPVGQGPVDLQKLDYAIPAPDTAR